MVDMIRKTCTQICMKVKKTFFGKEGVSTFQFVQTSTITDNMSKSNLVGLLLELYGTLISLAALCEIANLINIAKPLSCKQYASFF